MNIHPHIIKRGGEGTGGTSVREKNMLSRRKLPFGIKEQK